mgnify:CR=1 FL=1
MIDTFKKLVEKINESPDFIAFGLPSFTEGMSGDSPALVICYNEEWGPIQHAHPVLNEKGDLTLIAGPTWTAKELRNWFMFKHGACGDC